MDVSRICWIILNDLLKVTRPVSDFPDTLYITELCNVLTRFAFAFLQSSQIQR